MSYTLRPVNLLACGFLLLASACADQASEQAPAAAPPPAAAPVQAPPAIIAPAPGQSPATPPPSAAQLPITEDFEAEAETAIDARNYKRALAALSREIEKDKAK